MTVVYGVPWTSQYLILVPPELQVWMPLPLYQPCRPRFSQRHCWTVCWANHAIHCYSMLYFISLHFLRTLSKIILFNCGFANFVRVNNNCAKTTLAFSTDRSWTAPNCQLPSAKLGGNKIFNGCGCGTFKNKSTTGIGIIDRLDQCLKIERPIPKNCKKIGLEEPSK